MNKQNNEEIKASVGTPSPLLFALCHSEFICLIRTKFQSGKILTRETVSGWDESCSHFFNNLLSWVEEDANSKPCLCGIGILYPQSFGEGKCG